MRGMDFAPLQNRAERVGFVAVSETIAGVGGLKGSANMHLAWKAHIIASFLRLAISNWRKSCRIAAAFDVVNFQFLRKPCRFSPFSMWATLGSLAYLFSVR